MSTQASESIMLTNSGKVVAHWRLVPKLEDEVSANESRSDKLRVSFLAHELDTVMLANTGIFVV